MDGRPGRRARAAIDAALPQPSERRLAREAARRARTRRQTAIAAVSTVLVLGLLVTAIVTSEGWPTVRETFFSPEDFADAFPAVLEGFWLDVKLFLVVEVGRARSLGLVVALARISRNPALFPLRLLAAVFVDVLRGVPTILVVYLIGFGVPALMLSGLPTDPVVLGGIALTLAYSRLRRRGLPRGDRVGPPEPARGRAGGRADREPGAAPRRPAAGGPARRAAAAERLHLAPEGRRAGLDPRPARGVPRRPDRGGVELHLHAAGGRGAALPLRDGAAGPAARPLGAEAPRDDRRPRGPRRHEGLRRPGGAARDRPRGRRARRGRADRRVRVGQVDAAALHRPAGGDRRRRRAARRRGRDRPVGRSGRACGAGSASSSRRSTCSRT